MPSKTPNKADLIKDAPFDLERSEDDTAKDLETAYDEIGYLTDELAQTRAELERIQEMRTFEQVKAELIKPYANKVFWFVAWYCIVVGVLLVADGVSDNGFDLDESTVGIIAGSTAVSVIGLIGMVISGLFGRSNN